jgi:protein-tyrosine phosphatase
MASILVVCTGNVCRSPMAEGFLRTALDRRMGERAPAVASAGTIGWEGSAAMPETVSAARERGVDVSEHVARRLLPAMVESADLVLCMAREHADLVVRSAPTAAAKIFTLKELVRVLEELPVGARADLRERVSDAAAARAGGFRGNPLDDDVIDPLGLPLDSYRAVAWELEEWTDRLAEALAGPVPATIPVEER